MTSQNGNDGWNSTWGGEISSGSNIEILVQQRQNRLKQIMPSGDSSAVIVLAIIALVVLGAWSAYYTVLSDSIAVVQRPEVLTHGLAHQE